MQPGKVEVLNKSVSGTLRHGGSRSFATPMTCSTGTGSGQGRVQLTATCVEYWQSSTLKGPNIPSCAVCMVPAAHLDDLCGLWPDEVDAHHRVCVTRHKDLHEAPALVP